jgi:hypothetical protein
MALAIGHAALAAPPGLLGRLFRREFVIVLVKILRPKGCRALFGHLFRDVHEFQHFLRGQSCASHQDISGAPSYSSALRNKSQQDLPIWRFFRRMVSLDDGFLKKYVSTVSVYA